MKYIEASDDSGASFDDTAEGGNARYPAMEPRQDTTQNKLGMSISDRDFLFSLMRAEDLITGSFLKNGALNIHLTYKGHVWLQEYRQNTRTKRFLRWSGRQLDKLFSSVALPILAAVLTVFVLDYVGATGGKSVDDVAVEEAVERVLEKRGESVTEQTDRLTAFPSVMSLLRVRGAKADRPPRYRSFIEAPLVQAQWTTPLARAGDMSLQAQRSNGTRIRRP